MADSIIITLICLLAGVVGGFVLQPAVDRPRKQRVASAPAEPAGVTIGEIMAHKRAQKRKGAANAGRGSR